MKYYVILTKGNSENVVKTFPTEDEAVAFGNDYFSSLKPGDGVLTVELIESGKANRKLITGWHH